MSETSLKLYTRKNPSDFWCHRNSFGISMTLVCGYRLVSEHPENPLVKESARQTPPFKVE